MTKAMDLMDPNEAAARALNLEMRRQWSATQAPGPGDDPTSWTAASAQALRSKTPPVAVQDVGSSPGPGACVALH